MSHRYPLLAVLLSAVFGLSCDGEGSAGVDAGADAEPAQPDASLIDATSQVPCDPLTQAGCGPSEKCTIVPSALQGEPPVIGCVPSSGSGAAFEPCVPATYDTPDDCAPGLACVGTLAPRCLAFCEDHPTDTCGAGQTCALGDDLDGDLVVDVSYCAESCDLFTQDCSDPSFACYPTRQGSICLLAGAGGGPADEGEPCAAANSCAEGLGCFRIGTSLDWICFAICDPFGTGGPICHPGQTCYQVEDEVWGVCQDSF